VASPDGDREEVRGMAGESNGRRQEFLRAAYTVASPKRGPLASVHLHEVAKEMGLGDPIRDDDVREQLTNLVMDLQENGDVEGWSVTDGRFRLTSQGAGKVEERG
jgi:hypothetical protein